MSEKPTPEPLQPIRDDLASTVVHYTKHRCVVKQVGGVPCGANCHVAPLGVLIVNTRAHASNNDDLPRQFTDAIPGARAELTHRTTAQTLQYAKGKFDMASHEDERNEENGDDQGPVEIALVGDLTEHESDLCDKLLGVPQGGECTLYIDSPGGSAYTAIALLTLIVMRRLRVTGIVAGECSSSALWPFAACERRIVTPYSFLLFHPLRWQSEEHVGLAEASEWARHFAQLESEMDSLLADMLGVSDEQLAQWMKPGRYVTGRELAEAGIAELIDLKSFADKAAEK